MIDLGAFHMCRFSLEFKKIIKLHLRYWKKKGGLLNGTMIVSPMIVSLFKVELGRRLCYYIRSIKLVMKCMFPKESFNLMSTKTLSCECNLLLGVISIHLKNEKCVYILLFVESSIVTCIGT